MTDIIIIIFYLFIFYSKGQGVISAFSNGQGVTKRGQGAAPCKRSLGRILHLYVLRCENGLIYVSRVMSNYCLYMMEIHVSGDFLSTTSGQVFLVIGLISRPKKNSGEWRTYHHRKIV